MFFSRRIGINHNGNLNFAKKLINEPKLQDLMLLNFKKDINVVYSQDYLNDLEKVRGGILKSSKRH